ncbi:hypothetical protein [Marinobacter litoralis]|uniref:hypothetical protein n=1 Tax=Marinobacter litoralis TaxID=187981 RepID=UPI001D105090|nr:hypothetical protein [Marinobacter litoralis]
MQDQFDALSGQGNTRAFYGAFFHTGFEVIGVEELVFGVWHVLGVACFGACRWLWVGADLVGSDPFVDC